MSNQTKTIISIAFTLILVAFLWTLFWVYFGFDIRQKPVLPIIYSIWIVLGCLILISVANYLLVRFKYMDQKTLIANVSLLIGFTLLIYSGAWNWNIWARVFFVAGLAIALAIVINIIVLKLENIQTIKKNPKENKF